ncbi:MAG: beta-ketoacyl-[acyl-carrier-protein] synthase family protein [Thermoleophilia bacterium]|nr:beta-ketoacyl-[acyl-carrier-protein] synthase family protein [Thermoleophilia bacterium]
MNRRVVVTGLGIICALGSSAEEVWRATRAGVRAAEALHVEGLGEVPTFRASDPDADGLFGRREARRMDRVGVLAACAAAEALGAAGDHGLADVQIGASLGNAHGGVATLEAAAQVAEERGLQRISPLTIPLGLPNSAAAATARTHGLRGPSASLSTACAAGSDAIGVAAELIRGGRAEAMVAGGAEAPITRMTIGGYARLGALANGDRQPAAASRPFDTGRDGFVIGEGAGMLVLEERQHALNRGATILAEVTGYGTSCDAGHITDPDPAGQGPARAIRIALDQAGRSPAEVDYVNAHATSTPVGDLAEARALVAAGVHGAMVSATKSLHGHTLGAAGGIEAALSVLAIRDGIAPPTINLDDPEPEPALRHLTECTTAEIGVALSNSFGFGGHNACLVLETFRD